MYGLSAKKIVAVREMAVSGALALYYYYQHSYMDSMCIFNVFPIKPSS